jgi:MFS family permease
MNNNVKCSLACIYTLVFFCFLSINSLNNFLPEYVKQNFAYNTQIAYGFIVSSFPLGQFIGSFFVIPMAYKIGVKRVLFISISACIISSVIFGTALEYKLLNTIFFSRFICGFFESSIILSRYYISSNTHDEELKNKRLGLINTIIAFGFIIGPTFSGFLYHINQTFCYFFNFIIYLPCLYIVYKIPNLNIPFEFKKSKKNRIVNNLNIKQLILILLCISLYISSDTFYNYVPLYLNLNYKLSIIKISIILSISAFIKLLFSYYIYKLKRYFSYISILLNASIMFLLNIILICLLPVHVAIILIILQSLINTILNNFLIFYLTNSKTNTNVANSISNLVRYRAFVSGITVLISGWLSIKSIFIPFTMAILFMLIFIIFLNYWRILNVERIS